MPEEAVTPNEEMMKAIVELAAKQKALEEANSALQAKITAMSAPAAKAAEPAPAKPSAQEEAYKKVLAELGIVRNVPKEGAQ